MKVLCWFFEIRICKSGLTSVDLQVILHWAFKGQNWESRAIYKGLFQNERPVLSSLSKARKKSRRVLSLDKRERPSQKYLKQKYIKILFDIFEKETFCYDSEFFSSWIPHKVLKSFWPFWPSVQSTPSSVLQPKHRCPRKLRRPRQRLFQFASMTQTASNWAKEINSHAFSTFVTPGRTMKKLIPKISGKLAGKIMIVTLDKNVSDITISAWLIEASALLRWKVAKTQKSAAKITNAVAELVAKPSTTQNLPNYHAFLTWDVGILVLANFAVLKQTERTHQYVVTKTQILQLRQLQFLAILQLLALPQFKLPAWHWQFLAVSWWH